MKYSWLKSTPICNKGLFDNKQIFENTLPAISKAVDCGYNLFLDLALTKDNKLVVCDSKKSISLLTNGKKLESISSEEIDCLTILNTDQKVPLLSEVLECINGKVGIIFKIASNTQYKRIITTLLKELASYKGKTAIVATNFKIYFWIKKKSKNSICGIILKKNSTRFIYNAILFANVYFFKLLRPHFVICDVANLPNGYIDDFLASNPYSFIISRTVTDKDSYTTAIYYSDNYIFENYIIND